jgi:DhnA family fructose-bisphosphate aldolase class Ia
MTRGKEIRLSRLFNRNQNAVVIAIDHGYMDGPIRGMENLPQTIRKIDHSVDAVLLAPGMMQVVGDYFGQKGAPLSIVRLNWSTVFCFDWGYSRAQTVQAFSVEDAIRLGADLVLVSLTLKTGDEANDARNVELFAKLCNEARRFEIPVVGECFPNDSDNLSAEGMHDVVLKGTRILAELGADCVKTFHTHKFAAVVNACPLPILGLGGHASPRPVDSLLLAKREIDEGAKGVVFGRNAIQRPDPIAYQRALCDVVKNGLDPARAVEKYDLT